MIEFTKLKISQSGERLDIGVEIKEALDVNESILQGKPVYHDYFENCFIDKVEIYTDKDYDGTLKNKIVEYNVNGEFKEIELCITEQMVSMLNNSMLDRIIFVKAFVKGMVKPGTPCGLEVRERLETALNLTCVYKCLLLNLSEFDDTCEYPFKYINQYLLLRAVMIALKTCNYNSAIKWWNKLTAQQVHIRKEKCNCHDCR